MRHVGHYPRGRSEDVYLFIRRGSRSRVPRRVRWPLGHLNSPVFSIGKYLKAPNRARIVLAANAAMSRKIACHNCHEAVFALALLLLLAQQLGNREAGAGP